MAFRLGVLLAGLLAVVSGGPPTDIPQFRDVTAAAGIRFANINGEEIKKRYLFEAKGAGAGFFDFDNDGWMDLLLTQGSTVPDFKQGRNPHCSLYRNSRDGTFADVTEKAGLTRPAWGMGVAFGDYDNDGFVDIYFTNLGPNFLFRNNGDGTFTDVTEKAGVAGSAWSSSAAFGDFDRDGDLDLYVCNFIALDPFNPPEPGSKPLCNYRGHPDMCGPLGLEGGRNVLYRNNGDGSFVDVTEAAGVGEAVPYFSLGAVWADLDNDLDPDLVVANDSSPNYLFVNDGGGRFRETGFLSGLAANAEGGFQASMGVDAADYDNDGLLDIFMTHFANDYSTLYKNRGDLRFEDVTASAHLIQPEWLLVSWGTRFADMDHDGWKDIVHSNGHVYPFLLTAGWSEKYYQRCSFYLNRRDGSFEEVGGAAGPDFQKETVGRGTAFADFDNDGDIDFIVTNLNAAPTLYRHEGVPGRHWIMLKVVGRQNNRDGIGARVVVRVGGLEQNWEVRRTVGIFSASDPRAHFGLGAAAKADTVKVLWPNGKVQEFDNLPGDTHYVVDEEAGIREEF